MLSAGFLITSLIIVLVPGTGVIYTISTGIAGTKKNALFAAVGCTLGIIPHLAAGILGISAVLNAGAQIFRIIRIIGGIYLLYLGLGLITDRNKIEFGRGRNENNLKVIGKGILLNLLNPKLTLFFLSFLPQFIRQPERSYFSQMIMLSLVFMGLTLFIFIIYGQLSNYFKNVFLKSPKITRRIQQSFGIILIGFAAKTAVCDD